MWSDADAVESYLASGQASGALGAMMLVIAFALLCAKAIRYMGRAT